VDAILLVRFPAVTKMLWKTGNCYEKCRKNPDKRSNCECMKMTGRKNGRPYYPLLCFNGIVSVFWSSGP
jgi:hypothetical protein